MLLDRVKSNRSSKNFIIFNALLASKIVLRKFGSSLMPTLCESFYHLHCIVSHMLYCCYTKKLKGFVLHIYIYIYICGVITNSIGDLNILWYLDLSETKIETLTFSNKMFLDSRKILEHLLSRQIATQVRNFL